MPVLGIDIDGSLEIAMDDVIGRSVAILGITGSGKSNTAAVLVEELLDAGLPMTIVDIEDEYWGLKERFEVLIAGGEHADIPLLISQARALASLSATRRIPVVLAVGELSQDEMYAFLLAYFESLWDVSKALRQPYQVVLEEAHEFVPQGARTPLKEILTRIALRGRKRGLATVLVSQRSPKVDKDLLTQAQLLFLHRVVHPVDLRVYQDLIPLPARQVDDMVGALRAGQAVVLYKNQPTVASIRLRATFHGGQTPGATSNALPPLKEIDPAILADLAAPGPDRVEGSGDTPRPQSLVKTQSVPLDAQRIPELERQVEALELERQRLCAQLALATARGIVADVAPEELEAASQPEESANGTPEGKPYRSTKRQKQQFGYLLTDITGLRSRPRKMLRYLLEREGRVFSLRDIARGLDMSESTLQGKYFDLIQLGLVERVGTGRSRRFQSKVGDYFRGEFPDLAADELRQTVLVKLLSMEVRRKG